MTTRVKLPTNFLNKNGKKVLEKSGVTFLGIFEEYFIFEHVELPEGWKLIPLSTHHLSDLFDERNRKRAHIFIKPPQHDHEAYCAYTEIVSRFHYTHDVKQRDMEHLIVGQVIRDRTTVIFETLPLENAYESLSQARDIAKKWLDEHYPHWKNPCSYWDPF
jgi:hypothetical protein